GCGNEVRRFPDAVEEQTEGCLESRTRQVLRVECDTGDVEKLAGSARIQCERCGNVLNVTSAQIAPVLISERRDFKGLELVTKDAGEKIVKRHTEISQIVGLISSSTHRRAEGESTI